MKDFKRLFCDIEVSYCLARVWRSGKQVVTHHQIKEPNKIIMIGWKWQHEKDVRLMTWDEFQDDAHLVAVFQEEASKADVIIGQNSERFDFKHIAARLCKHSLAPLSIENSEDTFKLIKRRLALPSYSLDYMGNYFGLGRKIDTGGLDLWIDVIENKCPKAMDKMIRYCKQDVILLEKVYNKVFNYVDHKTNYTVLDSDMFGCPTCGSLEVIKSGVRLTRLGKKQRYFCNSCARYSTDGKNLIKQTSEYLR